MHYFVSYVRVRARIIIKINMMVDMYADSLSSKFYEDPLKVRKIYECEGVTKTGKVPRIIIDVIKKLVDTAVELVDTNKNKDDEKENNSVEFSDIKKPIVPSIIVECGKTSPKHWKQKPKKIGQSKPLLSTI